MSNFTPGKWECRKLDNGHSLVVTGKTKIVADCFYTDENARFIALAPEMYELLKEVSGSLSGELREKVQKLLEGIDNE